MLLLLCLSDCLASYAPKNNKTNAIPCWCAAAPFKSLCLLSRFAVLLFKSTKPRGRKETPKPEKRTKQRKGKNAIKNKTTPALTLRSLLAVYANDQLLFRPLVYRNHEGSQGRCRVPMFAFAGFGLSRYTPFLIAKAQKGNPSPTTRRERKANEKEKGINYTKAIAAYTRESLISDLNTLSYRC